LSYDPRRRFSRRPGHGAAAVDAFCQSTRGKLRSVSQRLESIWTERFCELQALPLGQQIQLLNAEKFAAYREN
jgi:hypothetical protein